MARYSMFGMAGIGIAAAISFVFVLTSLGSTFPSPPEVGSPEVFKNQTADVPTTFAVTATQTLKKFASVDQLTIFLLNVEANRGQLSEMMAKSSSTLTFGNNLSMSVTDGNIGPVPPQGSAPQSRGQTLTETGKTTAAPTYGGGTSGDFSTTNVQVQGVDEPDFIKNDGKYAYILSGDRLTIVDAYPAQNASIATKVALDIPQGQYLQNMFLNNDTLVIFYSEYSEDYVIQEYDFAPQPIYQPKTHALVMDVSDRENPKVLDDYEVTGNYNNARMIGNHVYLVTVSDLYDYHHPIIPRVMESSQTVMMPPIYYFDNPELYYSFNTVTSIDIAPGAKNTVNSTAFLTNPASTLYVSEDSIYIAYQKNLPYYYYQTNTKEWFFEAVMPLLPKDVQDEIKSIESDAGVSPSEKWDRVSELLQDTYNHMSDANRDKLFEDIRQALADYDERVMMEAQKTVIHKIAIGSNGINYESEAEVPGRLLNQFSMDESGDRFRVATTSDFYSPYRGSTQHNNVYVLDGNMKLVGKLEGIAKDESIYAARFMGDRLYLVTFRQTDPFFVIDMSQDDPKVLGELKLPGYSSYLHPYDEDHVIGVGRDKGVKLALFDVSDVRNPQLVDTYEIGGSGSDSEVLNDHKALLFDKSKDVLSIPVSLYPDYGQPQPYEGSYAEPKIWRGFYVFGVDPNEGFTLKGTVDHFNDTGGYYYIYGTQGSRSFYIGDVLYTVTLNNVIKMNDLQSIEEINSLDIGSSGGIIKSPPVKDNVQ